MQTRVRGKDESLPELAQSIKKLTRQAYPSAPSNLTSVLALEHFIDSIPDVDIRLRLREVNPKNINEAETLAVRLETLKLADRQKGRMIRQVGEMGSDPNSILLNNKRENQRDLREDFEELKKNMASFTKEMRDVMQSKREITPNEPNKRENVIRPYNQGSNQTRYDYKAQDRNFGQFNRNWGQDYRGPNNTSNQYNREQGQNRSNQGNQWRSGSGAGARQYQNGPRK